MNARSQGFTLVELLVVIVIGAIVLGAVYQTMTTQEKTNRQQIAVITTEQNTRMALELLTGDLREVSASGGDIYEADSLSISFRSLRKAGIICNKDFTNSSWADLAVLGELFVNSDSILVFQDMPNEDISSDDTWGVYAVNSTGTGTCAGNPFGNLQRLSFPANTLQLADTGALVRSFKRVGYRLVSSGDNGTLYRIESPDSVAVVENLASSTAGGLRLRYYDASGTEFNPSTTALRASIMRIQVKVTARYAGGMSSSTNRIFADSLKGMVFMRGNRKTQ